MATRGHVESVVERVAMRNLLMLQKSSESKKSLYEPELRIPNLNDNGGESSHLTLGL